MSLSTRSNTSSIRQIAIYAFVLTMTITVAIGALLVLTESSTELRLTTISIDRSKAILESLGSIGDGTSTNNTKVEITRQTRDELKSLCKIENLTFVFFPSYLTTKATATGSAPTSSPLSATAVPIFPSNHAQNLSNLPYQSPNLGLSFCAKNLNPTTLINFSYFALSNRHTRQVAIVEIVATRQRLYSYLKFVFSKIVFAFLFVAALTTLSLWYLYRRNLAETFGLTSIELSSLLQEQEALLKGISEGVIACDANGLIRFFNQEARRLIGIPERSIGRPLRHLVRGRRLRQIVTGEIPGRDLPVVVGRSILSISRLAVERDGQNLGHVITIQDRTEWEGLLRELDGMVGMTEALRAQAHEFSNKMHTIVGLIELGESEEAIDFALNISSRSNLTNDRIDAIDDPLLRALILAKGAVTSERGVTLVVTNATKVHGTLRNSLDILTIVGNLIDNALDAVLSSTEHTNPYQMENDPKWIELHIEAVEEKIYITVTDSGLGIPMALLSSIFTDGFSTKVAGRGYRRGLGLALVAQIAAKYNGEVQVKNVPGASFSVTLHSAIDSAAERIGPMD